MGRSQHRRKPSYWVEFGPWFLMVRDISCQNDLFGQCGIGTETVHHGPYHFKCDSLLLVTCARLKNGVRLHLGLAYARNRSTNHLGEIVNAIIRPNVYI